MQSYHLIVMDGSTLNLFQFFFLKCYDNYSINGLTISTNWWHTEPPATEYSSYICSSLVLSGVSCLYLFSVKLSLFLFRICDRFIWGGGSHFPYNFCLGLKDLLLQKFIIKVLFSFKIYFFNKS